VPPGRVPPPGPPAVTIPSIVLSEHGRLPNRADPAAAPILDGRSATHAAARSHDDEGSTSAAAAVKSPVALILPPPLTDQSNGGALLSGCPNWSCAVAENCCVPPGATVADEGVTVTAVSVWLTLLQHCSSLTGPGRRGS